MRTRAIGYIRVSTDGQAIDGVSLDAQSEKISAYANLNDFDLLDIFCDAGKSGKNTDRDGLQQSLSFLDKGEASALIVYKLDRLSRSVLDALNLISTIESFGASLHSIVEKLDTQSALGRFFVNMTAALSQLERDQVSERTVFAMAHKKQQGQHCGSPCYGFEMVGKKLVMNAHEWKVISLIKSMKADGATLQNIADELNAQGITTKRLSKWQPTQVSRVLASKAV
jgi:site-specific DNA recombinase